MIHSDARGALVVLTIDRPERRNALDHEALDGLAASLAACGDDVRALVLTGAGGHFCAGADLTGLEDAAFADRLRTVLTAALAPRTLRAHKAALEAQPDAQAAFERAWASEDLREGLAAFHDRRRPVFHGR